MKKLLGFLFLGASLLLSSGIKACEDYEIKRKIQLIKLVNKYKKEKAIQDLLFKKYSEITKNKFTWSEDLAITHYSFQGLEKAFYQSLDKVDKIYKEIKSLQKTPEESELASQFIQSKL